MSNDAAPCGYGENGLLGLEALEAGNGLIMCDHDEEVEDVALEVEELLVEGAVIRFCGRAG